jgi:hypothetical protein
LEAQTRAPTPSKGDNLFLTFSTSTVIATASRELEYGAHTVRDGTADYDYGLLWRWNVHMSDT